MLKLALTAGRNQTGADKGGFRGRNIFSFSPETEILKHQVGVVIIYCHRIDFQPGPNSKLRKKKEFLKAEISSLGSESDLSCL